MIKISLITSTQDYTISNTKRLMLICIGGGSSGGLYDGWKGGVSIDVISKPISKTYKFEVGLGAPKNSEIPGGTTKAMNSWAIGGGVGSHILLYEKPFDNEKYLTFHGSYAMGKFGSDSKENYIIFDDTIKQYAENQFPELVNNNEWLKLTNTISLQLDTVPHTEQANIIEYSIDQPYKPGAAGVVVSNKSSSGCSGAIIVVQEI